VLEGGAKGGVRAGRDGDVLVVHAPRDGDSEIVARPGGAAAPRPPPRRWSRGTGPCRRG
jgi:hypothetical protein